MTSALLLFVGMVIAQNASDFLKVEAQLRPNFEEKSIAGDLIYTFKVNQPIDSVSLDAHHMTIQKQPETQGVSVKAMTKKIVIYGNFQPDSIYSVDFSYKATPKQTLYFFEDQIWTQGQGKYTSHWLPSIDDVNDKMMFNISVTVPEDLTALAGGRLDSIENQGAFTTWQYVMEKPMSSYLAAMVIGHFKKETVCAASGIPIENYFLEADEEKVEPTYRYTKQIFDFLETEIGVSYPWEIYKQVPVRDFLYAGMENTTLTVFANSFMIDTIGFIDKNYVNVNAHELAHHWFGNMVTAASEEHHWLQEGFATYYALLAEREIFGDDYFYWNLFQSAEALKRLSDTGKGESLLQAKASSLTYYQKGAWALHILRERIGDEAFRIAVKNYVNSYAFKSATTDDFLSEAAAASGMDLSDFKQDWLLQSAFRATEALQSLKKSKFIVHFMETEALRKKSFSQKRTQLEAGLQFPVNDYIGQEIVYQLHELTLSDALPLYRRAFDSNNLLVRQAIAVSVSEIPLEMQQDYESLLADESYATQEFALLHLWMNFKEKQQNYLDRTRNTYGFSDKNIRQLWLALAIATEDYENENKQHYFEELASYTSPYFSFEIRQITFRYLNDLQLFTDQNLYDLMDACQHPNW
ncbi:MAG TPA: M1 family metallopeptidase, partial [Flavobacteriaceae bacterium]|nr:M1 family metallopeptidase [Flavobacteriaceae bacterium]